MEYGALRSLPATEEDDCASLSPVKKYRPAFKSWSSHARLQLSEDLVAEILTRLPAKSVAKFRCVSTTWLSIATDPSFILSHARRSPKTLLVRSFSTIGRQLGPFRSKLFSFSASGLSFGQLSLDQISDVARSSCNGLVLFLRMGKVLPSCEFYVMNPLTGLFIDIPNPNESNKKSSMLELYYHRWTGEYRILNIRNCKDLMSSHSRHLDAEVLSLAGDCPSPSWSQIKAKVPFVSFFFNQSGVLVNDRLYWTCQKFSEVCTILVFDILKETFSFMEPPSYGQKASPPFADKSCSEFGLVDIEGNLCFWVVYKDKSCMENITIHVWTAMDGDEKLKNTYSMCFNDERLWAFYYPHNTQFRIVCCLCVRESELLFLFDVQHNLMEDNSLTEQPLDYLFHWDLKSGKYWTEPLPAGLRVMMSSGIIYKETLITTPFRHTTALTHALL